jgi:glycosyltransferase involved in cell wall biosynthesis
MARTLAMSRPTLALCVPAYNAAGFLYRLLESARSQTVPFDEIWVYDDASTDHTSRIARQLGAQVVWSDKNIGCSRGKNILANRSQCSWLHFHDADDALELNFVETARRWMELEEAPDVVFFNYRTHDHETGQRLGTREFDGAALRREPLRYCLTEQINPFCGLYRKEPFLRAGGWDEDSLVLQSEDQAGHLRLALAGLRFDADPAYTVINYIREGSMTTSNLPGAQRSTYHVLRKAAAALAGKHADIVARRLWSTAGLSGAYGDWENADRAAELALKLQPDGPTEGSKWFRRLATRQPGLALRLRERYIRVFRPDQRTNPVYHRPPVLRPGT